MSTGIAKMSKRRFVPAQACNHQLPFAGWIVLDRKTGLLHGKPLHACAGWEVVCPDGLVRHYPYHNLGDAEGHVKLANDPAWFAERGCRLAPNPAKLEQAMPRCCGGKHSVRACAITQAGVPHDETLVFYERQCFETRGRAAFIADKMEKES